jgi:hypothetical protein
VAQEVIMSSSDLPTVAETFIDRWGHWVLWMGPYILIVSLLSWTPRLALLLVGVELLQFTWHVLKNHPTHPIPPISAFFVGIACTLFIVGSFFYPILGWAYMLIFCQIWFSLKVHDWIHSRDIDDLLGAFVAAFCSAAPLTMMIVQNGVPGLPLLRSYLISG